MVRSSSSSSSFNGVAGGGVAVRVGAVEVDSSRVTGLGEILKAKDENPTGVCTHEAYDTHSPSSFSESSFTTEMCREGSLGFTLLVGLVGVCLRDMVRSWWEEMSRLRVRSSR